MIAASIAGTRFIVKNAAAYGNKNFNVSCVLQSQANAITGYKKTPLMKNGDALIKYHQPLNLILA